MSTDTSEKALETLIVEVLVGHQAPEAVTEGVIHDPRSVYGGMGYVLGNPADFDRGYAVDVTRMLDFLWKTQPDVVEVLQFTRALRGGRTFLTGFKGRSPGAG